MHPCIHVTLIWQVDCTFPRLPTRIVMRIDKFALPPTRLMNPTAKRGWLREIERRGR